MIEKILNSNLTMNQKILTAEIITKANSLNVTLFTKNDLKLVLKFLIDQNYCFIDLDSCLKIRPIKGLHRSKSSISKLEHLIINTLLNQDDDCICLYTYLNYIDLLDIYLYVETNVNKAPVDVEKLKLGSNSSPIKEEIITEKRQRNKELNESANKIVDYFRSRLIEYNQSIEAKTYLPPEWQKTSQRTAKSMLKTLKESDIIAAIDWFFTNDWWKSKITSLEMVSRHYQKYVSNRGNTIKYKGLLKKAMEM